MGHKKKRNRTYNEINFTQKEKRDHENKNNQFKFLLYCKENDITNINLLLDKGIDINSKDIHGTNGFHIACMNGHIKTIKLLLKRGIDINAIDNNKFTGLHFACGKGHLEIVKLLLDKGADVNAKDNDGCTGFLFACEEGFINIVTFLINSVSKTLLLSKNNDNYNGFHLACEGGHFRIVNLLLNKGIDCNIKLGNEYTAFHLACEFGYINIVKLLIENGIEMNKKTIDGYTGLQLATNQEIIDYLTNYSSSSLPTESYSNDVNSDTDITKEHLLKNRNVYTENKTKHDNLSNMQDDDDDNVNDDSDYIGREIKKYFPLEKKFYKGIVTGYEDDKDGDRYYKIKYIDDDDNEEFDDNDLKQYILPSSKTPKQFKPIYKNRKQFK
jgi:ankyrin repeat protein